MHSPLDGYLRISQGSTAPVRESSPTGAKLSLLFVDIVPGTEKDQEAIRSALQAAACGSAATVLFRWPHVVEVSESSSNFTPVIPDLALDWLSEIAADSSLRFFDPDWIGLAVFYAGHPPSVAFTSRETNNQPAESSTAPCGDELLDRAIRVEFMHLLEWGHAIWKPQSYHYELPSGLHSDTFVRVADAFRTPRDAQALATWLARYLSDDLAIFSDSASLVSLILALQSIAISANLPEPQTIILDEYPSTILETYRSAKFAKRKRQVLVILSVNATGRYLEILRSVADRKSRDSADRSDAVVLVNKQLSWSHASLNNKQDFVSWVGLSAKIPNPMDSAECKWCRDSVTTQIVRIDPRSYEAVALPGTNLVTPNYQAAEDVTKFWTSCFNSDAIGVVTVPSASQSFEARSKSEIMNIRIDFGKLLASPEFQTEIKERCEKPVPVYQTKNDTTVTKSMVDVRDLGPVDSIVASKFESSLPEFQSLLVTIRECLRSPKSPLLVLEDGHFVIVPEDGQQAIDMHDSRSPLILSLGSVSGWNVRQLLFAVQKSWHDQGVAAGEARGLVVHARPVTIRQWENTQASFRRRLYTLWTTFLPQFSPIHEEWEALKHIPSALLKKSPGAGAYYLYRKSYCNPRIKDWADRVDAYSSGKSSIDPRLVLWGLDHVHDNRVLNESLYGTRVDAMTAYVAVGAAMQSTRQHAKWTDPRWMTFDFDSISRSYYDGILVASMLRWVRPHECYWGSTSYERKIRFSV